MFPKIQQAYAGAACAPLPTSPLTQPHRYAKELLLSTRHQRPSLLYSLVLSDSQKRAIFDVYGVKGLSAGSEV